MVELLSCLVILFFSILCSTCLCFIWVTYRVSYKKQELLTLREHLGSPMSLWRDPRCSSFYYSVLGFVLCLSYSCALCARCCRYLWIFHSWLPLVCSLTLFWSNKMFIYFVQLALIDIFTFYNFGVQRWYSFNCIYKEMLNSFTFLILDTIYFISHTFYSHFYCQSQYIHFILFYFKITHQSELLNSKRNNTITWRYITQSIMALFHLIYYEEKPGWNIE